MQPVKPIDLIGARHFLAVLHLDDGGSSSPIEAEIGLAGDDAHALTTKTRPIALPPPIRDGVEGEVRAILQPLHQRHLAIVLACRIIVTRLDIDSRIQLLAKRGFWNVGKEVRQ